MGSQREMIYEESRWAALGQKRELAKNILELLADRELCAGTFGSLARGDVRGDSDVDLTILDVVPSLNVEIALETVSVMSRREQQATPQSVPRAVMELEDDVTVYFPLVAPGRREQDFYCFAGYLELPLGDRRVQGVDKRLMLVQPTPDGHRETPLSDISPGRVARILGVDQEIVDERLRVLLRRARVGRTGTYLNSEVPPHETFESFLANIVDRDPAIRRRVRGARK